jgi:hypothetical protein
MLMSTSRSITSSLKQLSRVLVAEGVEIFAERENELQIAERVRMHLMDSGVRVRVRDARVEVEFTATATRSEHPSANSTELFERLRVAIGANAIARGYRELGAATTDARDPQDAARVLDVFYEIGYALTLDDSSRLADEVRWALSLDKALPRS